MQAEDYDMAQAISRSEETGNKTVKTKEKEGEGNGSDKKIKPKKPKLGEGKKEDESVSKGEEGKLMIFNQLLTLLINNPRSKYSQCMCRTHLNVTRIIDSLLTH